MYRLVAMKISNFKRASQVDVHICKDSTVYLLKNPKDWNSDTIEFNEQQLL